MMGTLFKAIGFLVFQIRQASFKMGLHVQVHNTEVNKHMYVYKIVSFKY